MQKNPAAEEVIRRLNAYYDAESEVEEELRMPWPGSLRQYSRQSGAAYRE